ncbi:MAG: hypothetical protein QG620_326 [Patescibacteria group bacterium]|nr:hypothetical protein [Patescibacteria group bacterium]
MKLDKSYKLFFAALVFLVISEISGLIFTGNPTLEIVKNISKVTFSAFFLGGILEARSMLRDVDGEKNEGREQK